MSGLSNEKFATRTPEGVFGSAVYNPGVCAGVPIRFAGQPADGDTVTIGGTTFEFDNNATVTAGNTSVTIGGSAQASMQALIAAINAAYDPATYDFRAFDLSDATDCFVVKATPDDVTTATSDSSANITVGAAALAGGRAPNEDYAPMAVAVRTAVSIEDTEGHMYFAFPFVPRHAIAIVADASASLVQSADVIVTITSTGMGGYGLVTVADGAALQLAAGDVVTVIAFR